MNNRMYFYASCSVIAAISTGCEQQPSASVAASKSDTQETAKQRTSEAVSRNAVQRPTHVPGSSPVQFELGVNGLPTTGMWKCDPVVADFNNDGHADIAILPRLGRGPAVFLGDSKGNWIESSEGLKLGDRSCGGGMTAVDINKDGHLDLVVADHCNGVFVYLGDGAGQWTNVASRLYPSELVPNPDRDSLFIGAEDLDVADVNGDGHLDIVTVSSDEGGINVYFGDSTGENWDRDFTNILPTAGWGLRVQLHDMNGDGYPDIVASHSDGPRCYLNDGKGGWTWASGGLPTPRMQGIYHGLAIADFNQDGRLDIAVANWVNGPELYLQTEDHAWEMVPDIFPRMLGGAVGLDAADLNLDGFPDIVCAGRLDPDPGYVRGVFVLLNQAAPGSTPVFTWLEDTKLPSTGLATTSGITLADINGDSRPDILAGSGLIVETGENGLTAPVIPHRVIVWITSGAGKETAANADSSTAQTRPRNTEQLRNNWSETVAQLAAHDADTDEGEVLRE